MALESPLFPSPGALVSAFSPYTDSPSSPAPSGLQRSPRFSSMAHEPSDSLRPPSAHYQSRLLPSTHEPPEPSPTESSSIEPSPIDPSPIEPSPITSNGTEIEDSDDNEDPERFPEASARKSSHQAEITSIDTSVPNRPRSGSDETPQSVIHVPGGFKDLELEEEPRRSSPPFMHRKTPSPSPRTDLPTDRSPTMLKVNNVIPDKNAENSPLSPPPISTAVGPSKYFQEGATPRAQTRQEVELLEGEKLRKPRSSSSLEDIPEAHDPEIILEEDLNHESFPEDETISPSKTLSSLPPESEEDIKALKTALDECWTLCNTLAGLSSNHRERIFNFAYTGNIQEQAWKTCWKLCQKLYDSRDDDHETHVRPTLDLCRNFCQALFDVRRRDNEIADSVLRVSFELNNHLYNTHDRNLPEAFRERTLDFYITLCHRLMKQRSILAEETDSLLRACWSLAEMLFSLRQNKRDGKPQDEELLGSAVQACWELCDLFREGWTQVRPERGTPRPSQTTFPNAYGSGSSQKQRNDLEPLDEQNPHEPETPTTIFEDTALSPDADELSPPPNILVLGTDSQQRPPGPRWSSNASTLSGYSANSAETSSTATTTAVPPSAHQPNHHNSQLSAATSPPLATSPYSTNLKLLIFKVALNSGFQRSSNQSLQTFVKTLSPTAFGSQPWQVSLLDAYRKMIMSDRAFRTPIEVPSRRASASEVSRAVTWLLGTTGGSQHGFLRELFRLVFGFTVDEGERRGNVFIQT